MSSPVEVIVEQFAPSPQQQHVRDRGGSSNVLVAAAGSGKTRVLTWLYCDAHTAEGVPLTALLAITFTDKAAGELRRRIAEELRGHTLGREPDLSEAWIGTFHAISTRILREFAHHRGLDPAFGVIEELDALELQAEAWEQAVGVLLEQHGAPAATMFAELGSGVLQDAIVQWWSARRSAGEVHPEFPQPETTAADVETAAFALTHAADLFGALVQELQDLRKSPLASLDAKLSVAEQLGVLAAQAAELARAGKLTDWHIADVVAPLAKLEPKAGQPIAKDNERHVALVTARERLLAALEEVAAAPRVALLADLAASFSRRYEVLKRRVELLDFDDLELEALQLLRENEPVRRLLTERFTRVLVDEFQDTNPRQAELVDLLAGGEPGGPWAQQSGEGRPAVTVVGDPRQAIYGFRYADVGLIAAAARRIGDDGQLRLSTNYRSDAEVLGAIDAAFTALDPAHEAVDAHRGPDRFAHGEARVELLVTKEAKEDSWDAVSLGARPGERGGPKLAEARLVAARIRHLREREPDRSVVVLARARSVLGPIAEALGELDIPALIDGAEGFWERLEVADVLAWLRLVRNPADDAALVAVCAGPLLGLSTDGLAAIGLLGTGLAGGLRIDALRAAVRAEASFGGDDTARLDGLLTLLEQQREPGRAADPAGLIDELLAVTGYDEHLLRLPGGDRRVANIVRLRRLAAGLSADGRDLTDLVDRAEKQQAYGLRAPEAAIAGRNAVTLMTVHQAKGLEYDTVVVAGLGSRPVNSSPAVLGDAGRLGLKLRPAPGRKARSLFAHAELVTELQEREQAELRRVLYVALTRARERLIISGVANWTNDGSPFSGDGGRTATVLAWLAPALVPEIERLVDAAELLPQRSAGGIELRVSTPAGAVLPVALRAPELVDLPTDIGTGPRPALVPGGARRLSGPSALSYSALTAHAACGLRFHAEHVLRLGALPEPPGTDGGAPAATPFDAPAPAVAGPAGPTPAQVGSLVHELLEVLPYAPRAEQLERELSARAALLDPTWAHDPAALEQVRALVQAALTAPVSAALWSVGEPRRELPFTIAVGPAGRLITGIIDVWQMLAGGEVLIVDYKTDRVDDRTDLEDKTASSYALQRAAYALAALKAGAERVRVVHLFLRGEGVPTAELSAGQADAAVFEAQLAEAAAAVDAGEATETPAPNRLLCEGCPARGTFCGWAHAATARWPRDPVPGPADWLGDAALRPAGA